MSSNNCSCTCSYLRIELLQLSIPIWTLGLTIMQPLYTRSWLTSRCMEPHFGQWGNIVCSTSIKLLFYSTNRKSWGTGCCLASIPARPHPSPMSTSSLAVLMRQSGARTALFLKSAPSRWSLETSLCSLEIKNTRYACCLRMNTCKPVAFPQELMKRVINTQGRPQVA